jgi:hypothetical protein
MADAPDTRSPQALMTEMKLRHRQLDIQIRELELNPYSDQLAIRRLKKEKLRLKDCIALLRTRLIPDLDA